MKTGIELITDERERQIKVEKWTPKHDDEHTSGELAMAAALYATPKPLYTIRIDKPNNCVKWVDPWPWHNNWFEPGLGYQRCNAWDKREEHQRIKQLKIAGALIAAEIDRLNRIKK